MWHRMVQEFFLENAGYTFFDLGNYSEQEKYEKNVAYGDNMYMEILHGKRTKVRTLIVCNQTEN